MTPKGHPDRTLARAFTHWEVLIVGAAALASMLSPRLLLPALVVASIMTLARWVVTGRLIFRTPADWPILLLLLLLPMALWVAPDRQTATPQALRLVLGILLYYSVAHGAGTMGQRRPLAIGLTGVGVLLALAAPFVATLPGLGRLSQLAPGGVGGSVNPNVLAGAILLTLAFPLAALLFYHRGQKLTTAIVAALCSAVLVAALALTRSRGAVMGLGAMVLVLTACRWRRGWVVALIAAAAALLITVSIGPGSLLDSPVSAAGTSGLDLRFEIWTRAQYALQDFPLSGIGIGNFGGVVNLLYPTFLMGTDTPIAHAHNLFLQIGLDLGLAGLSGWLAAYMLALVGAGMLWHAGLRRNDRSAAALGAALLAGQAATGVHGLTDAVLWSAAPALLLWAAWGLCVPTPESASGEEEGY